ncbi:MAG: tRNA lysidine(34) synthetase TilS [Prevotellaceae bacterium]|jgi:tRNA(Ile)-lysidine synthase|nr:tRNA lysidine(34) synthetase TilS [Prevotellaceae bacterium]
MIKLFINYIALNKLINPNDKILLGVSGGIDSMVLCDLFLKANFNFSIAHCNFQLRGDESNGDELLVEDYARLHNIPYHVTRFDTVLYAKHQKISIQMAARHLRYNWFTELTAMHKYSKIAVAHHADDSIETFFINLTRGTGLNGLCGIPVTNQLIIRPLLFAHRQQINNYATEHDIKYREDSSNSLSKYARNRMRLNIIPKLEKINPSFRQTMLGNISHLQKVQHFVANEMNKTAQNICSHEHDKVFLDIAKIEKLPYSTLFLYYVLQEYGFKNETVNQIAGSLHSVPGKRFHSRTHTLLKDREYIILFPHIKTDETEFNISKTDEEINYPIDLSFKTITKIASFTPDKQVYVAQFDFNKLKFPLTLRKWRHGDSFIPFGMKGRKKLSNYFSDNKYSLYDKENQWILTTYDNEIIWVVGKRIDNRFKIDEQTKLIWQIELLS